MKQEPKMRYETGIPLRPASIEEAGLFYSQVDADEDLSSGTVGHIRMDFGHVGKEFWHTWWPHNDDQFNTQEFKADLQTVVDALRTEGPLRDLATMRSFCNQNGGTPAVFSLANPSVNAQTIFSFSAVMAFHEALKTKYPATGYVR